MKLNSCETHFRSAPLMTTQRLLPYAQNRKHGTVCINVENVHELEKCVVGRSSKNSNDERREIMRIWVVWNVSCNPSFFHACDCQHCLPCQVSSVDELNGSQERAIVDVLCQRHGLSLFAKRWEPELTDQMIREASRAEPIQGLGQGFSYGLGKLTAPLKELQNCFYFGKHIFMLRAYPKDWRRWRSDSWANMSNNLVKQVGNYRPSYVIEKFVPRFGDRQGPCHLRKTAGIAVGFQRGARAQSEPTTLENTNLVASMPK